LHQTNSPIKVRLLLKRAESMGKLKIKIIYRHSSADSKASVLQGIVDESVFIDLSPLAR